METGRTYDDKIVIKLVVKINFFGNTSTTKIEIKTIKSNKKKGWITQEIIQKDKLPSDARNKFKDLTNRINAIIKITKRDYYKDETNDSKQNIKRTCQINETTSEGNDFKSTTT